MRISSGLVSLVPLAAVALSGCRAPVDSTYGRTRGVSVNGTGVLAEMFRAKGHTVKTAIRLTDEVADWADVVVRFAPYGGPPEREEAAWFLRWLTGIGGRRLVYVPNDYNALRGYWTDVIEHLPKGTDEALRKRAETLRSEAKGWSTLSFRRPKERAGREDWFAVKDGGATPQVCKTLEGPWSAGIDPARAALERHETVVVGDETVLLRGDGEPLVVEWTVRGGSRVLVAANGSFLLNETLVNAERRPLALRVVDWVDDVGLNVAFVEGGNILAGAPSAPSGFALLFVPPFGWVVGQLLVLGLAACLARAPRLGRPRPGPPSGEDRPVAHPEALGALMARAGQASDARTILESYRRWRTSSRHPRAGQPPAAGATPSSESPENE